MLDTLLDELHILFVLLQENSITVLSIEIKDSEGNRIIIKSS
jgi:hypothetical protein